MPIPVNDRDLFLYNASIRDVDPRNSKYVLLTATTPIFRVNAAGAGFPSSIDITALPIGLPSTAVVNFNVGSGATLTGTGLVRTLAFSDMTLDTISVGVSVTDMGQTYTAAISISKVADGSSGTGTKGDTGNTVIMTYLYKFSTVQPALPTGTATCTTSSGKNTSYSGTDSWYVDPPNNPGSPGLALYVAQKSISVPYGVATTSVTYTAGATVTAYGTNGLKGDNGLAGVPGIKNTQVRAYRWSTGPAPTISGTATYTWASATYDTVPSGWSKTKTDPPSKGYTLYEASVGIVDSTGATTSSVDFGTASIVGISYVPLDGNGTPGATGNSVAIAYTLVVGNTLNASPNTFVAQGTALPTTGTWGETNAWTPQPSVPAAGQSVFQSNGIYNGTTTTWGVPYLSSLRVGSLSALTVNTGNLTISGLVSSANGNFAVDQNGNVTMKSASMSNGIFTQGNVNAWAAWPAAGSGSNVTYLGPEGLMMGSYNDGRFFVIYANGDISTPQFYSTAGKAFFNGTLGANTVTADNIQAGAITAGKIGAGAITATKILVGTPDNSITDPDINDLTWWGWGDQPIGMYTPDYNYGNTPWKSRRTLLFPANGNRQDRFSQFFPMTPGAVYRAEYSAFLSGDFNGVLTVVTHLPGQSWYAMGGPNRGYAWSAEEGGLNVSFDVNSPKGYQTFSEMFTMGGTSAQSRAQIRIIVKVYTGYIEIGGMSITRATDNVLIQGGAVTADKISVGSLQAVSANIGVLESRPSGARVRIENDIIRVINDANIVKVKIGNRDL